MGRIDTVLFDLDGTLTEPQEGITRCITHALQAMGCTAPPPQELLFAIGPPLRASFRTLLDTDDPARIERAMAHYRERFATVGLFENQVYPGIAELLARLRAADYTLYVATAKPHIYATQILDHFDLLHSFAAVYGAELDGTRQHKADLLAHLLAEERLDARNCVMVGDRADDIDAAGRNGCGSIGVLWGYGSAIELQAAHRHAAHPAEIDHCLNALHP